MFKSVASSASGLECITWTIILTAVDLYLAAADK